MSEFDGYGIRNPLRIAVFAVSGVASAAAFWHIRATFGRAGACPAFHANRGFQ